MELRSLSLGLVSMIQDLPLPCPFTETAPQEQPTATSTSTKAQKKRRRRKIVLKRENGDDDAFLEFHRAIPKCLHISSWSEPSSSTYYETDIIFDSRLRLYQ